MTKPLTHDELQHIEHGTKILQEHLETVRMVVNETEGLLNTYVPIMRTYIESLARLRQQFGQEVSHIIQSSRELKVVTGSTPQLMDFCRAIDQLDKLLTPALIDKLQRVSGQGEQTHHGSTPRFDTTDLRRSTNSDADETRGSDSHQPLTAASPISDHHR